MTNFTKGLTIGIIVTGLVGWRYIDYRLEKREEENRIRRMEAISDSFNQGLDLGETLVLEHVDFGWDIKDYTKLGGN